jgi:pyrroloquinoline quinone biosynthesis protein B
LVDVQAKKKYLIEATPDFPEQLERLNKVSGLNQRLPDGIFLTHAHIGHYTGLMYLGREALGASLMKVYAMPRMLDFLTNNGPWSQLVELKNIVIEQIEKETPVVLSKYLTVVPIQVPHRDEYSETVGFIIKGSEKSLLFIPDIDKWDKWEVDITSLIEEVDYTFLDATFFEDGEINRDMEELPHPFVAESMGLFDSLPEAERNKVWFIHMNHTNPLLNPNSKESLFVEQKGYHIARVGDIIRL